MSEGKSILVVDDDADIRKVLRANLEDQGYDVREADGGESAIVEVESAAPDLVILDVMMPEVDGYDVLTKLRSRPETENLPVVLLTARRQESDVWEGWSSGADYYMTKPFKMTELVRFVQYVFGE